MRALIETLELLDQFESSTTHLAAIMAFEVVAVLSLMAGDVSVHDDNNVVI